MKIEIEEKKLDMIYRRQNLGIACFLRKGNEKNILFLHGLGCAKEDFRGAAQSQGLRDYTLLAFDFPGCGGSSYPENMEPGMDDLVEITHLVVSQLDIGKCILVGHSMGGLVALLYSESYRRDVTAFINVEGNLTGNDCFISRKMIKYEFSEFRNTVFPQFIQKMLKSANIGFKRYGEILQQYSSPRAFYDYCPSLIFYSDEGQLIKRFLKLKVPKLFIYGSENRSLPYIQELRKGECDIAEIPNSNHCPNYDNPEEFYQVIANFLKCLKMH